MERTDAIKQLLHGFIETGYFDINGITEARQSGQITKEDYELLIRLTGLENVEL